MRVSVIRVHKDGHKSVKNEDVAQIMERIRSGRNAEDILCYREAALSLDSPSRWVHADRLKYLCPTSEYSRKASGELVWRLCNGVSVLRMEGVSGPAQLQKAKNYVRQFPQVFCAFEGADGHSLMVWTLSRRPDGTLPTREEEALSFSAQAYAVSVQCLAPSCEFTLQVEEPSLDKSCLMSYDPELYLNPHPVPFSIAQPARHDVQQMQVSGAHDGYLSRLKAGPESYITLTNVFNAVYRRVRKGLEGWRPVDDPLRMVLRVAEECTLVGVPQEEVTHRLFLMFEHSLREDEVRGVVENVYSNVEVLGHKSGLSKHQQVAYRLREFLDRRYDIRFNEVLQTTEFRERQSLQFLYRELGRRELNSIHHEALIEGIEPTFGELDNIVHSSRVPLYNPITSYLDQLPQWDGRDHIAQVAGLVPNRNPHWERLFRQWMLSMVAHWMNADQLHANATAPILIGKQGYRKSTFCRMLLPPEMQQFFTDSIDFRSNVEAERSLSRFLLVNIDEFDQLSERQFAFVKHLFQKPQTNIRRMYSEAIGTQRRYASFIGTSNHQEVLRDPTGNRRYICVEVTAPIRVEEGINHAQLYAQAQHLINHGERYWLNDEDEALLKESNQAFEAESPLEQIFCSLFTVPLESQEGEWMRAAEILETMSRHRLFNPRKDKNLNNLGKVLTKQNVVKSRKADGMVYWVRRR